MNADYVANLKALRQAFGPSSETPLLVDILSKHFRRRDEITMLDVGIGNGASAGKVTDGLTRRGIHVALTGIDPYIPASARRLGWASRARLVPTGLADFHPGEAYDVVNAKQSLYYLGDEGEALKKLASLVSPGGILTITVWDSGCTLKTIHDTYLAPGHYSPSGVGVGRCISEISPSSRPVEIHHFDGQIMLSRADATVIEPILKIASRGAEATDMAWRMARDYLASLGPVAPRRNAVVVAT
ncbi:class I SAM-dependent methyltransferase [Micromonospora trifolii]|uniref:class I SAM-dependent methyltransferase n=1 Tax=Micromonospora trifolii TaxID=2911208 RepID=UPI003D2F158E